MKLFGKYIPKQNNTPPLRGLRRDLEMPEWITVHQHKGYDIKVLQNAGPDDEQGYKVDSWVLWANSYPTIGNAVTAIDDKAAD